MSSSNQIKWHDGIMDSENIRSQLTCCSVSEHFLVFGAKAGTLYIHDRQTLQRLLLVSSAEFNTSSTTSKSSQQPSSSITKSILHVQISPNEEYLGVVDSDNIVHILQFATNNEKLNSVTPKNPKLLASNREHVKTLATVVSTEVPPVLTGVTCLCWASTNLKLFSGDANGFVYEFENSTERRKKTSLFLASSPKKVLKEEGSIVQIDASEQLLLVSSTKRSVIVNLKDQKYSGIGAKLRDGVYGACFLETPDRKLKKESTNTVTPYVEYVFAARPGRRIWCADKITCKVLSTLKFPAVTNAPNLRFTVLNRFGPYIVSWNTECVAVVDVVRLKIVESRYDFGDVIDVSASGNDVYILHGSNAVSRLNVDFQKPDLLAKSTVTPVSSIAVTSTSISPQILKEENLLDTTFPTVSVTDSFQKVTAPPLQPIRSDNLSPPVSLHPSKSMNDIDTTDSSSDADSIKTTNSDPTLDTRTIEASKPISITSTKPDTESSYPTSVSPLSQNTLPVLVKKKKGKNDRKRRKADRLIEFDDPSNPNQVKATPGRVIRKTRKSSTTTISGSYDNSVTDNLTSIADTDMSNDLSDNRTELDAISDNEASDNEEYGEESISPSATVESEPSPVNIKEQEIPPAEENVSQQTTEEQVEQQPQQISEEESTNVNEPEITTATEPLSEEQTTSDTLSSENTDQPDPAILLEIQRQEELKREQERIQKEEKEREEKLQREREKKRAEFEQAVLSKIEGIFDEFSEFLLTNENTLWSPEFLPSLHKWVQLFIQWIKAEESSSIKVIASTILGSNGISKQTKDRFSQLLDYWFKVLIEGKIELDSREKSSLDTIVSHYLLTLHQYLDMRQAIILCNQHRLLLSVATILKIEDDHDYLKNEKLEVELQIKENNFDNVIEALRKYDAALPSIPLRYIHDLLQINFDRAIAYCASQYPLIQSWNVEQAIEVALRNPSINFNAKASLPQSILNLEYLVVAYESSVLCSQDSLFMLRLFTELVKYLGHHAQQNHQTTNNISTQNAMSILKQITIQAIRNQTVLSPEVSKLEKILLENGCMEILLDLYEAMGDEKKLIHMLVKESKKEQDYQKLERFMESHSKADNWLTLLQSAHELKSHNVISLERIVSIMCMVEGSAQTLQILKDCSSTSYCETLNATMYRKICESAKVEAKQNKLKHELLETVDSYMWSEKEIMISPQVRSILSQTITDKSSSSESLKRNVQQLSHLYTSFKLLSNEQKKNDGMKLSFEHDRSLPRFNEDWSTHWGIEISSDNSHRCSVCRLPIKERKGSEIVVFNCGHAFHNTCVHIGACVICQDESFDSLLLL
jgi:hypothetical protein